MKKTNCDWCFTVNEIEHHPYRAVQIDSSTKKMTPYFDIEREVLWSNRQELPPLYRFNGGVIAGKTEHIENNKEYNISKNENTDVRCVIMNQNDSIDIDNKNDLKLAEIAMKRSSY